MPDKEPLTNDQKIEILTQAGCNDDVYKKMINLIVNYDPNEKPDKEEKILYRARLNKEPGVTSESVEEETIRIAAEILTFLKDKGYSNGYVYAALGRAQKMVGLCPFNCPSNLLELCILTPKNSNEKELIAEELIKEIQKHQDIVISEGSLKRMPSGEYTTHPSLLKLSEMCDQLQVLDPASFEALCGPQALLDRITEDKSSQGI